MLTPRKVTAALEWGPGIIVHVDLRLTHIELAKPGC